MAPSSSPAPASPAAESQPSVSVNVRHFIDVEASCRRPGCSAVQATQNAPRPRGSRARIVCAVSNLCRWRRFSRSCFPGPVPRLHLRKSAREANRAGVAGPLNRKRELARGKLPCPRDRLQTRPATARDQKAIASVRPPNKAGTDSAPQLGISEEPVTAALDPDEKSFRGGTAKGNTVSVRAIARPASPRARYLSRNHPITVPFRQGGCHSRKAPPPSRTHASRVRPRPRCERSRNIARACRPLPEKRNPRQARQAARTLRFTEPGAGMRSAPLSQVCRVPPQRARPSSDRVPARTPGHRCLTC